MYGKSSQATQNSLTAEEAEKNTLNVQILFRLEQFVGLYVTVNDFYNLLCWLFLAGEENELASLVSHLDTASTKFGMDISAEKTKLMTNEYGAITSNISVHGQKLEAVDQFEYLEVTKDQDQKSLQELHRQLLHSPN